MVPTSIAEIIAEIQAYQPSDNPMHAWDMLADRVKGLQETIYLSAALPEIIRVFERFPEVPLFTSGWVVAHVIEGMSGEYEILILESLARKPSDFTLRIAARMVAFSNTNVDAKEVMSLLNTIASDDKTSDYIRKVAGFSIGQTSM